MTTVKCPICKERIMGATTEDLNMNLADHFAEVHRMSMVAPGTTPRAAVAGAQPSRMRAREYRSSEFYTPETLAEREVETWSNRDPSRWRPENYIPREEVRQWRYPVTGEEGQRGPVTPTRRERRMGERRTLEQNESRGPGETLVRGTMMINCPLCGEEIRGADEGELTDELRDHLRYTHDIRPKVGASYTTPR